MLLKGFTKYEEIRKEFNMETHTTTTTTTTGFPGAQAKFDINFSGVPTPAPAPAPGSTSAPTPAQPSSNQSLEERVKALEQQNSQLRAELDAYKSQQNFQNQTFQSLIDTMQNQIQAASSAAHQATGHFGFQQ